MKKINIYGAPGTDRYTFAALLYFELKKRNLSVGLVREFYNKLLYLGSHKKFVYPQSNVDYLIVDEPVLLQSFYSSDQRTQDSQISDGDEHHYFLERSQSCELIEQTPNDKQNDEIEKNMQLFLTKENVEFIKVRGEETEKINFILKCENII